MKQNKRALYESIMNKVSKVVMQTLEESMSKSEKLTFKYELIDIIDELIELADDKHDYIREYIYGVGDTALKLDIMDKVIELKGSRFYFNNRKDIEDIAFEYVGLISDEYGVD